MQPELGTSRTGSATRTKLGPVTPKARVVAPFSPLFMEITGEATLNGLANILKKPHISGEQHDG